MFILALRDYHLRAFALDGPAVWGNVRGWVGFGVGLSCIGGLYWGAVHLSEAKGRLEGPDWPFRRRQGERAARRPVRERKEERGGGGKGEDAYGKGYLNKSARGVQTVAAAAQQIVHKIFVNIGIHYRSASSPRMESLARRAVGGDFRFGLRGGRSTACQEEF